MLVVSATLYVDQHEGFSAPEKQTAAKKSSGQQPVLPAAAELAFGNYRGFSEGTLLTAQREPGRKNPGPSLVLCVLEDLV